MDAAADGAGRAVHAGAHAVSGRRVGAVGVGGPRRHQEQGQRLEAKGVAQWPQAEDRSRPRGDRAGVGLKVETLDAREDTEWGRARRGDVLPT